MNMNNLTTSITRNLKKLGVLTLLSIGALTIQSCSKDETPVQEYGFLSITNTSPTLATFNIYVDQKIINSQAVAYLGTSGYMPLTPGSHTIKFTTASSTDKLIEKSVSTDVNSVTSLFLIDRGTNMDYLTVKDELGNGTSSKAFVRFINLSPNAPALDLAVKDGAVLISDKAYKASSAFIEVDAKAYVFQIKDKATGTTFKADLESADLKAGKSYTVIATGLQPATDTERAFGGKVITAQ
jgi:hypothetical protein